MSTRWFPTMLLGILLAAGFASAGSPPQVKMTTAKPTSPASGKEMFSNYCASCHGIDGKGSGPAAKALKSAPTDLTRLSLTNKGTFPELRVVHVIEGSDPIAAHGSRDMPIWGKIFHDMDNDHLVDKLRLSNVTGYIRSIQAK